jgi:hypothetical protein
MKNSVWDTCITAEPWKMPRTILNITSTCFFNSNTDEYRCHVPHPFLILFYCTAVSQGDLANVFPAPRQLCHTNDVMLASPLPRLPEDYNELLHTAIHTSCGNCGETPKKPAQCLVCGAIVCPKSKCCTEAGKGECTQHAERCAVFGAVFL